MAKVHHSEGISLPVTLCCITIALLARLQHCSRSIANTITLWSLNFFFDEGVLMAPCTEIPMLSSILMKSRQTLPKPSGTYLNLLSCRTTSHQTKRRRKQRKEKKGRTKEQRYLERKKERNNPLGINILFPLPLEMLKY